MTIRITVEDLETGDSDVAEVPPGQYAVICAHPCGLTSTIKHDRLVASVSDDVHTLIIGGIDPEATVRATGGVIPVPSDKGGSDHVCTYECAGAECDRPAPSTAELLAALDEGGDE